MENDPIDMADDHFWLSYGKKVLAAGPVVSENAFDRLEKFILWLWAAYTGCFTLSASLDRSEMPVWAIAILALPVFLFPMTYWFCVWVKRPVGGTFDPTSPTQIEEFYDKVISKRVVRIRWLCCILFVCSLSVGLSLSVYKWVKVDSPDKIRVKMEKTAGNIFVSGMFLEEKFVRVRVSRPTSAGPDTTIYLNTLRTFNKAIYLCIQDTAKNWPVRVVVGYSDRLDGSTQEIQVSQQFQEK